MAVRLNVLVLRPGGSGGRFHQQFDDVIGQLLGRPGLDVTLLERLPSADDTGTERLALEALGGHIACLAWSEPKDFQVELSTAGKPMVRRPHQLDPAASEDDSQAMLEKSSKETGIPIGRMFYFDMRQDGANTTIFASLQELLKTLQTPMFQIQSLGASKPPTRPASPKLATPQPNVNPPAASKPATPQPAVSPKLTTQPQPSPMPIAATDEDAVDEHLDRLVDELDDLNL
ncbi:hypothetical protein SAMN06265222_102352 [Neorhodopirellula lusitana]|uniref:Uncharacterized protein n=1 Tax=Neorhodopirellula lusitana TaxID=445327 RepID=A0ABY1PTZ9_9BACT|nr:hypothetical protein [Neorhodopirellula lusitana]SMP47871.1 hypothetical protein SAMN06265222_102352 [Neorhodopirellula lusitana]